jgi:hypothetical protein
VRIPLGGFSLSVVPPSTFGRTDACVDGGQRRADLVMHGGTPDQGRTRVFTATRLPLQRPGLEAALTEGVTFVDGRLVSGVVDPEQLEPALTVGDRRCELRRGGLILEGDRVVKAPLRRCRLAAGADELYADGTTTWTADDGGLHVRSVTLAGNQSLHLGDRIVDFAAATPIELYPTGEIQRGQLLNDTLLPAQDGGEEPYAAGKTWTFARDGRVLRNRLLMPAPAHAPTEAQAAPASTHPPDASLAGSAAGRTAPQDSTPRPSPAPSPSHH